MNVIEVFKKLEMSKKLTVIILVFWIAAVLADIVIYLICGRDINIVVDYINTAFLVILGSYFGKSMVENVTKIKLSEFINKTDESSNSDEPQG